MPTEKSVRFLTTLGVNRLPIQSETTRFPFSGKESETKRRQKKLLLPPF